MTGEVPKARRTAPWWRRPRFVGWVVAVLVIAGAVLDTTWVSDSSHAQAADTASQWADLNYASVVVPTIKQKAQPLDKLLPALVADANATGSKFGKREDAGKPWSFATTATGTISKGQFGEVGLDVQGLPSGLTVGVAIPPLGSDTSIRVIGTNLTFGDFVNQTEYQNVALELNKRAAASVFAGLDLTTMMGQKITVTGAFTWVSATGGAIDHVTIIPVAIEKAS